MREFKELLSDVEKGIEGKNQGIPTGFIELDKHINGIQKGIYTLIGGNSGTGKSAYAHLAYILNPYDWLQKNLDKTDFRLRVILNSMERSTKYLLAKWTCLKIYQDKGFILDVPTLLGWQGATYKLTEELRQLIYDCEEYFEKMSDVVTIHSGATNATGLYFRGKNYAEANGKIEHISEHEKVYIPNNPNEVVILLNDHVGKVTSEVNGGIRLLDKAILDKHTEMMGGLRDFYHMSPVDISQFNRSIGSTDRIKNKQVSPEPDDFKGSGDMYENADVCLGLFNPYKFKINDFLGYDIPKFVSPSGENRFRSVSVIKNSYGADDVIIGMNFLGENGHFRELPGAEFFKAHPDKYKKAADYQA